VLLVGPVSGRVGSSSEYPLVNDATTLSRAGEIDPELVGEVDEPLGCSAVVEPLEVLADGLPSAALLIGSSHRGRKFAEATIELGVVHTVDQRLLQFADLYEHPLIFCRTTSGTAGVSKYASRRARFAISETVPCVLFNIMTRCYTQSHND